MKVTIHPKSSFTPSICPLPIRLPRLLLLLLHLPWAHCHLLVVRHFLVVPVLAAIAQWLPVRLRLPLSRLWLAFPIVRIPRCKLVLMVSFDKILGCLEVHGCRSIQGKNCTALVARGCIELLSLPKTVLYSTISLWSWRKS